MSVSLQKNERGVAIVTLAAEGRSTNVINPVFGEALRRVVEQIELDSEITGVIITSDKRDFMVGADLEQLRAIETAEQAFMLAQEFKALLRRLEKCGRPVVAALNGSALGGGLELALACHHRILVNAPSVRVGLPEVKLGLLPGGGGTQRLARILGMQACAPLLLEGKELKAEEAKALGVVHELAANKEELMAKAFAFLAANKRASQPWDNKGFVWPGGDPRAPEAAQMLAIAPSMTNQKTHGNYPAPIYILACLYEGALVDFDTACLIESRYFASCATSQVARNMIETLWFQLQSVQKGRSRPAGIAESRIGKLGVIGAGMMGAGIAYVAAKAGISVVLLDATQEQADNGKAYSQKLLDGLIKKGRIKQAEKELFLERIVATTSYDDLKGADLVIEAVFEDRKIKADVTAKAEAQLAETAIFASNTSTLPITGLAEVSVRPARFVGLHFFSPVDKMPLVEIIVGEKTSDETLAQAFDFVRQIGKTPIVVRDARGFYTSRVFSTYVMEGAQLLREGQHPRSIEVAGLAAGMPVGPLALLDEVNMALVHRIEAQNRADSERTGAAMQSHPGMATVARMVELKRTGKKERQGFYDYPEGATKHLWPELSAHFPRAQALPERDMVERLLFIQANEAVKCFAEGVVRSVADTNIGSIFGWGFGPCHGGALQFVNAYGVAKFVARSAELATKYGPRFTACSLLVEMAARGESFHG